MKEALADAQSLAPAANIETIAQIQGPIFADPRMVMLELVLAQHEIEAAISLMKRGWWGP
jgi:hypothetical protein